MRNLADKVMHAGNRMLDVAHQPSGVQVPASRRQLSTAEGGCAARCAAFTTTSLPWAVRAAAFGVLAVLLAPAAVRGQEPFYVLITVDVETTSRGNPQADIWGRKDGSEAGHGITEIMDILDRHGVKGTFFVNVYEANMHGGEVMADVCRAISRRGHDAQLHTHPQQVFGVWEMAGNDLPTQERILRWGKDKMTEWTGIAPVAHRAGAFAADLTTIAACKNVGLDLDFSLCSAWPQCALAANSITQNAPRVIQGILLVPVSVYVQASCGEWKSWRYLDIESCSEAEIRKVIDELRGNGVKAAVIVAHSWSLVRSGARVRESLDDTLSYCTQQPGIKVVTARQLHDLWRQDPGRMEGKDFVPRTGWWMTYRRSWQRLDEGWKNTAVAMGPPLAIVLVILTASTLLRRRQRRAGRAGLPAK